MSDEELKSVLQKSVRRLRRYNTLIFLVAVICASVSAYCFTDAWTLRIQLNNSHDVVVAQREQMDINRRSLEATLDALRKEQELAGQFESQRNANWSALLTSERHRVIAEQWFSAYRKQHGDNAINWNAYYKGLEK